MLCVACLHAAFTAHALLHTAKAASHACPRRRSLQRRVADLRDTCRLYIAYSRWFPLSHVLKPAPPPPTYRRAQVQRQVGASLGVGVTDHSWMGKEAMMCALGWYCS